uniref:Uncharacterized protein n=1 Tax=Tanacetum cinerariifolium TaxID=118510 RepID=A0A6L2NUQ5_TANCI|nr:hypothetical protein [Tanacetum cinerariifolium]
MDNKKHIVNLESFREMLHICPRIPGQAFAELPFEAEILDFIRFLGHSATIRTLTDGLYQKRNVDYAFLIWEDFVFQVEHNNQKKSNEMYYLRFTKVIIHHFMSNDPSIPQRNKVNWHYVRDDFMFSMIKLVSRHQNTQQFGAMLPIELTNEEIRNSKAYKEYHAIAIGEAASKPKASARRTRSGSNTSITPPTTATTTRSTSAATPRLTATAKGKQTAKASNEKSLSALFEHGGSGTDEGTGSKPGVPDVPTDESEEELSWNSSDDEGADDKGKDGNGDEDDEGDDGDGKEVQGLNVGEEERLNEEEKADELYKDVDINQGRVLQVNQEVEDSYVILTSVHPDGQQESSSVSSQFVTNMLNPISDAGMESIFTTASTSVAPLPITAQTMTPSTVTTITTTSQAPILPIPIPSKIILDTYGETVTLKRRCDDDEDKDEETSAGPDRGSKRRREGKEPESASTPSETATKSAGRSTTGSRSRQASASESAFVEEPVQTTSQMEDPSHPEFEIGADDQPIEQSSQHPELFSQPKKPPSLDRDWNKTLPRVHESIQPWISELAKQADTRSSFNELIDTPLDFSNFIMNRLRFDTLTLKLLAGPTYDLVKGSCKSLIELEYHLEEVYKATTDQLDWVNPKGQQYPHNLLQPLPLIPDNRGRLIQEPIDYDKHALWGVSYWGRKRQQFYGFAVNRESARDIYSKRRIIAITKLKIVEWHSYKHLDWITVRRDDDKLYKFKEGDLKRLRIQDIKDMLLLLVQGKLTNLTVKERFAFNVSLRMFTRSIVIQRRVEDLQLGVESYQKKLNLTKLDTYRDETLIDVRTALDDLLKGIRMQYLPQTIWRQCDKDRAAAMIQAIDKRLKTMKVMRSLERFVGGRLYEEDFKMLQMTI